MQGSQNNPPISQRDSLQPCGTESVNVTLGKAVLSLFTAYTLRATDTPRAPLALPLNTLAAGNPPLDGPARELGAGLQEGLHQGETPRFKQREFFLQETFSSLDPGAGGSLSCLLHHLQGLPPPSPATSPFLLKEAPSGFFLHLQPVPLPKVTLACLCWNKCSVITVCLAWPAAGGFCLMSKGPGTFQGMTVSGGPRRVATGRLTPDVRCPPRGAMSLFLLNPTRGSKAVLSRRFLGNLR